MRTWQSALDYQPDQYASSMIQNSKLLARVSWLFVLCICFLCPNDFATRKNICVYVISMRAYMRAHILIFCRVRTLLRSLRFSQKLFWNIQACFVIHSNVVFTTSGITLYRRTLWVIDVHGEHPEKHVSVRFVCLLITTTHHHPSCSSRCTSKHTQKSPQITRFVFLTLRSLFFWHYAHRTFSHAERERVRKERKREILLSVVTRAEV